MLNFIYNFQKIWSVPAKVAEVAAISHSETVVAK